MTPPLPGVGEEVAGYRLDAVVGRGEMSTVYRAGHPRLDRTIALKVIADDLATDELFRLRFLQVVPRIAASLTHPNVVPIYDVGAWGDLLFIAMRYIAGPDLGKVLQEQTQLDPDEALTLVGDAARALDTAHDSGLVHGDVKPANILIEQGQEGDPDRVYVTDFGNTKRLLSQTGESATGELAGTVDYIAPEMIQGHRIDGRADVYSLACILYQCLTGHVPFDMGGTGGQLDHPQAEPPDPSAIRPELGSAIDAVLARGLAKAPEDRFPTCRDLVAASRRALEPYAKSPVGADFDDARAHTLALGNGAAAQVSVSEWPADDGPAGEGRNAESPARAAWPQAAPRSDWIWPEDHANRRRALGAVAIALLIVAAVVAGLSLLGGGGPSKMASGKMASRKMPSRKMPASNPLSRALRVTNESATANHLLPPTSCVAQGASTVTCTRPAFGATTVTFSTYPSIGALYSAYLSAIKQVSPGPFRANFGDCTGHETDGEVSWNHNFEHPRRYSLMQAQMGRLSDNQAAGRVFCTFSNSMEHIIWTQNDGHVLGVLSGAPHDNTFNWWMGVHHSIDLGGSGANMSMS